MKTNKYYRNLTLFTVFSLLLFLLPFIPSVSADTDDVAIDNPTAVTCANFSTFNPGDSIAGLDVVHPNLNISTLTGDVVAIAENSAPGAYGALSGRNGELGVLGGFVDIDKNHDYVFTFAPDVSVSNFSLRMNDYGDLNTLRAMEHSISMVGYDAVGDVVSQSTLEFTSDAGWNPTSGSAGNLQLTGDATTESGNPGNFTFSITGSAIVRVEMHYFTEFGEGVSDRNHGLTDLCFEFENQFVPPEYEVCADFSVVEPGQSVEGLGTIHPDLNITSSTGNTVARAHNQPPGAYGTPLGINYGMDLLNGFSDLDRIHEYSFSFSPDVSVNAFTIRMLDYGDLNKILATEHDVTLEAYDINGDIVDTSSLSFISEAKINPESSSAGNLVITGDATASVGNPGNFVFTVLGEGIVRLEMKYSTDLGPGVSDPNHGLAILCFEPETPVEPELDPPTAALELLRPKFDPIGGQFRVTYACSESAPNLVSATLNGLNMVNGQNVVLIMDENDSFREDDGLITFIFGPEFSLDVTCADDAGNEVSTSVVPDFTP